MSTGNCCGNIKNNASAKFPIISINMCRDVCVGLHILSVFVCVCVLINVWIFIPGIIKVTFLLMTQDHRHIDGITLVELIPLLIDRIHSRAYA